MAFVFNPFTGTFDIDTSGVSIGDPVGSGTFSSVLFVDSSGNLAQDNSNLFWDDTNDRLGVGTDSPTSTLHLGAGTTTTAPLGFSVGELLDTTAVGKLEFDGANYYATVGGYSSSYPPTQSDTYVKATSFLDSSFFPHFATDPTKSLIGVWTSNSWASEAGGATNQRFHIDLGSAKTIKRIYYENGHNFGSQSNTGANNFTFWGSNTAGSFAELTYGTDTGWTQITTSQSALDEHTASDVADPKYITLTNSTPYRYYAFKFADNHGNASFMIIRRIELQEFPEEGERKSLVLSDSVLGSGTIVHTLDGSLVDDANFVFDGTNMGIGTANPSAVFHIATVGAGVQAKLPNGSVIAGQKPGIAFNDFFDTGFAANANNIAIYESGTIALNLTNSLKEFRVPSDYTYAWSSSADNNTGSDTSFLRVSAGVLGTGGKLSVGTTDSNAQLNLEIASSVTVGQIIKGAAAQSANLQEWQDSASSVLANIDSLGNFELQNFKEFRFYDDGANYVGFEAPALTGNQIWVLPDADGTVGQVLRTDGSGTLSWDNNASEKSWAFKSPSGTTGTFYYGGFYHFHTTSFTPAGGTNVGTANSSYAAHALVVLGANSTDMVVRVTGTSITDAGVRTAADTGDIDTSAGSTNDYYETPKKWIGQVSYTLQSGTGVTIDAGFAKYWDNNNTDFNLAGFEATWLGGANDSGADIQVIHHKATGWTYSGGGGIPIHPTAIATMAGDHGTEGDVINGENGAWKRANLLEVVNGGNGEGTIIKVVTTANKTFDLGNLMLRITPQ